MWQEKGVRLTGRMDSAMATVESEIGDLKKKRATQGSLTERPNEKAGFQVSGQPPALLDREPHGRSDLIVISRTSATSNEFARRITENRVRQLGRLNGQIQPNARPANQPDPLADAVVRATHEPCRLIATDPKIHFLVRYAAPESRHELANQKCIE